MPDGHLEFAAEICMSVESPTSSPLAWLHSMLMCEPLDEFFVALVSCQKHFLEFGVEIWVCVILGNDGSLGELYS